LTEDVPSLAHAAYQTTDIYKAPSLSLC